MQFSEWPSLTAQIELADTLYGARENDRIAAWFEQQVERIDDPAFARRFSDHIDLPGIVQGDYNHRHVRVGGRHLLGGIRFYGQDITRPFVEVFAHDFDTWETLGDCVAAEWRSFNPRHMRILAVSDTVLPPAAMVDMSIYAARYRDMGAPDGHVSLAAFGSAEEAVAMVAERYADTRRRNPVLAQNVSAANTGDLHIWHRKGQALAIRATVDGVTTTVGLLAIAPGAIAWIDGDQINEEVVATACNGRGFASCAQRAWARLPGMDRDRLLIGTIHRLNTASRRTAISAGRRAVMDYVFLPLT